MKRHLKRLSILACLVFVLCIPAFAQTADSRQIRSAGSVQTQTPNQQTNSSSQEIVATELGLLRKSLQTLNVRLREIIEKVLAPDANQSGSGNTKQIRLSDSFELLSRAEQRAELLRKQLVELIEKETSLRSRLLQIEEDLRPENIERSMNLTGSTRTSELRESRRRVLENDRKGFENLLVQTSQTRIRLDDDVRQADQMVYRLRQRLFPLIEKEIDKIGTE
jgi:hypothetical protein